MLLRLACVVNMFLYINFGKRIQIHKYKVYIRLLISDFFICRWTMDQEIKYQLCKIKILNVNFRKACFSDYYLICGYEIHESIIIIVCVLSCFHCDDILTA